MNKIILAVLVFGFALAAAAPSKSDTDGGPKMDSSGPEVTQKLTRSEEKLKLRCSSDYDCPGPFCCIKGSCAHFMYCN